MWRCHFYVSCRRRHTRCALVTGVQTCALPIFAAPKHSGVATVDWTFLRRNWGNLRAYVNWQYTGWRQGLVVTEDRRDLTATSGHGIWNARLSASDIRAGAGGSFAVSLWGRNLAEKDYDAARETGRRSGWEKV